MELEDQETNDELKERCIQDTASEFLRKWPRDFGILNDQ